MLLWDFLLLVEAAISIPQRLLWFCIEQNAEFSLSIIVNPQNIQEYLHQHIPLSAAMQVSVNQADESGVILSAPLDPNINHRDSVFGGSLSALAILSAWTYLHRELSVLEYEVRLVIQRNSMEYAEPALGRFAAKVEPVAEAEWQRFLRMLERKGKGRISVPSRLFEVETNTPLGAFEGQFVAIRV